MQIIMTHTGENYIRFDWAIKRLLRNKANHAVLEGFPVVAIRMPIQNRPFS